MAEEKLYQLALSLASGVGNMTIRQMISYCGSPENIFKSNKAALRKIPGVGSKAIEGIFNKDLLALAEKEQIKNDKSNVSFTFVTDQDYPERLKKLRDAPCLLYTQGVQSLNFGKSVAIVGTRQASPYGKEVTEHIVKALKPYDPVIISGLAYGIDIAAHRATLKEGMKTIAVVASGLDIIYPAAHRSTFREILDQGAVVTENKLGTKPDAHYFPARNRIIAGLADVLIVVEAGVKGGALITANLANDYHKDVLAVPGNLGNQYSAGCNNLIRDNKAHVYTGIEDIEMLTNWDQEVNAKERQPLKPTNLSTNETLIYNLLYDQTEGLLFDDIAWQCQIKVNELASALLGLEFGGHVTTLPGKKYKLKIHG